MRASVRLTLLASAMLIAAPAFGGEAEAGAADQSTIYRARITNLAPGPCEALRGGLKA